MDLAPLGLEAVLRAPAYHVGEHRTEVGQPVDGLDAEADVGHLNPRSLCVGDDIALRKRSHSPMVDAHQVCCYWRDLAPANGSVDARNNRPRPCVGASLAGEVPGIELGDRGVDVIGVKHDRRNGQPIVVDLDDAE